MTGPERRCCPLCGSSAISAYHRDRTRDYLICGICKFVFVPTDQHLSPNNEKAYYDLHDNQPDDAGYRRFLERLFTPLNQRLAPGARGFDFGCGPGPTLSRMFEAAGHSVALYDPYYAADETVLTGPYDFITLSEVAEHLAEPGKVLGGLWRSLAPGGWLGIMTKRVRDREAFKTWHYITDPTHIGYFSEATFRWLADQWSAAGPRANLVIAGAEVVLIRKG